MGDLIVLCVIKTMIDFMSVLVCFMASLCSFNVLVLLKNYFVLAPSYL